MADQKHSTKLVVSGSRKGNTAIATASAEPEVGLGADMIDVTVEALPKVIDICKQLLKYRTNHELWAKIETDLLQLIADSTEYKAAFFAALDAVIALRKAHQQTIRFAALANGNLSAIPAVALKNHQQAYNRLKTLTDELQKVSKKMQEMNTKPWQEFFKELKLNGSQPCQDAMEQARQYREDVIKAKREHLQQDAKLTESCRQAFSAKVDADCNNVRYGQLQTNLEKQIERQSEEVAHKELHYRNMDKQLQEIADSQSIGSKIVNLVKDKKAASQSRDKAAAEHKAAVAEHKTLTDLLAKENETFTKVASHKEKAVKDLELAEEQREEARRAYDLELEKLSKAHEKQIQMLEDAGKANNLSEKALFRLVLCVEGLQATRIDENTGVSSVVGVFKTFMAKMETLTASLSELAALPLPEPSQPPSMDYVMTYAKAFEDYVDGTPYIPFHRAAKLWEPTSNLLLSNNAFAESVATRLLLPPAVVIKEIPNSNAKPTKSPAAYDSAEVPDKKTSTKPSVAPTATAAAGTAPTPQGKPVRSWTVDDVCNWIRTVPPFGPKEAGATYASAFRNGNLNGDQLVVVTAEELKDDYEIQSESHVKKIMEAIKQLA